MKKLFLTLIISIISICSYADGVTLTQAQLDSLPKSAQIAIKASQAKAEADAQAEAVSKYVGLGKEVGEAVNGALGAVEKHVLSIADTPLGHTAIFIVCWKLLYKDIIGVIVGIGLLILMTVWIYKSTKFQHTEQWDNWDSDQQEMYQVIRAIGWIILFLSSMICIFA